MTSPLKDRSTPDVIVLILTMVVGFVVVVVTLLSVGAVIRGDVDAITTVLKAVGNLTNGLIALIVGYIAGKGTSGNGRNGGPKPPESQG
jgi:hypothetical protein